MIIIGVLYFIQAGHNKSVNQDLSKETAEKKRWEDLNVAEQYNSLTYAGSTYTFTGSTLKQDDTKEYLGRLIVEGINYKRTNQKKREADVYSIHNIADFCAVAVELEGKFYIYANNYYFPKTLGEMFTDLELLQTMLISEMSFYNTDNGSWEVYAPNDQNQIMELLLLAGGDAKNIGEEHNFISDKATEYQVQINLDISISKIGAKKISISLDNEGYLTTNILGSKKAFFIGIEEVDKLIHELKTYGDFLRKENVEVHHNSDDLSTATE